MANAWVIKLLIRRTAQHGMDHAWKVEDRDVGDTSAKGASS